MKRNTSLSHGKKRRLRTGLAFGAITALALPASLALSAPAFAAAGTTVIDGMTFVADSENPAAGATLTAYATGSPLDVVVPQTIDIEGTSFPVKKIGDLAFSNRMITSIELPDGLLNIGVMSFMGSNMEKVDIPDSVVHIGQQAFQNGQLKELDLPETSTVLDTGIFWNNQLTKVDLPDGILKIEGYVFADNNITEVDLPPKLQIMGDSAFMDNQLAEVVLPPTVWQMTSNVFAGNSDDLAVYFTGPAPKPKYFNGAEHNRPSLGKPDNVTVHFSGQYESFDPAKGFTQPDWRGYDAVGSPWIERIDLNGATEVVEGTAHTYTGVTVDAVGRELEDASDAMTLRRYAPPAEQTPADSMSRANASTEAVSEPCNTDENDDFDITCDAKGPGEDDNREVPVIPQGVGDEGFKFDGSTVTFPFLPQHAGATTTRTVEATLDADPTKTGTIEVQVKSAVQSLRLDLLGTDADGAATDGEVIVADVAGLADNPKLAAAAARAGVDEFELTEHATFTSSAPKDRVNDNEITVNGKGARVITAKVGTLSVEAKVVVNENGLPEPEVGGNPGNETGTTGSVPPKPTAGKGDSLATTGGSPLTGLGAAAVVLLAAGAAFVLSRRRHTDV